MNRSIGVVIATYNERDNVVKLLGSVESVLSKIGLNYWIIVVDDNSPDGTASVVEEYAKNRDNILLIKRPGKMGLGSAIKTGLEKLLGNPEITHFVTIDADLSHNPSELPGLIEATSEADVVIGSRYIAGGRIIGWSLRRRLVSRVANLIVRILYRTGLRDHTSNYRVYSRRAVDRILKYSRSNGYEWVVETILLCRKLGLKITEKPISFINREKGRSKLRISDIIKWFMFILRYRKILKSIESNNVVEN